MSVDYSLRTKRNEFRLRGIFYTPRPLGEYMKSFLPEALTEIYDPTCGHGALLELFGPEVKKYGQEINEEAIEPARSIPNSEIVHGDTLTAPAFLGHQFRGIIANPPFSMRWTPPKSDPRFDVAPAMPPASKADFAFLLHILYFLSEDGTAVTIISGGALYREQAEGKIRRWMVDNNYIDQIISIPADTFEDTGIVTILLVLKKSRPTTDITFADKLTGASVSIPREKIIEQDYRLSPAMYLPAPKDNAEPTDWKAETLKNETAIRQQTVEGLKRSIEIARMMKSLFPDEVPALAPWLKQLHGVIYEAEHTAKKPVPKDIAIELLQQSLPWAQ